MDRDARFRTYPETRVTDVRLIDTGSHSVVDTQPIVGLEVAAAWDSHSFRSEYLVAEWDQRDLNDLRFKGFYLQAIWAVTGEAFKYAEGKFLRIRPERSIGAFEIAIGYSRLNLNDLNISGG